MNLLSSIIRTSNEIINLVFIKINFIIPLKHGIIKDDGAKNADKR